MVRGFLGLLTVAAICAGLSGCGWIRAGDRSPTKPSGFVLRGYVTAPVAGGGEPGSLCQVATVAANEPVRVTDSSGHELGSGALGAGVLAIDNGATRCNFPFSISAVPGGHRTYSIAVGARAPLDFPATDLREDKPAVIPIGS